MEKIRKTFRPFVPKPIYRLGADIINAAQVIKTNGFRTFAHLYYSPNNRLDEVDLIQLKNFPHPFFFRPNTPDVNTLVQNLIRQEYGQLPLDLEPKWIVDAGGYIGDVSVYFLNRFKNCRVLCLEPDPQNYSLAVRNLKPYADRSIVLQKGLWSYSTQLNLSGSFVGAYLTDSSSEKNTIDVCDIETLLQEHNIGQIDLLKLDVEGAEELILQESINWLPKVKSLIVEFHGTERKKKGVEFLHAQGYWGYQYRSLYYFFVGPKTP